MKRRAARSCTWRIAAIRLHLPQDSSFFGSASGDIAKRGWVTKLRVANPMSIYPGYAAERRSWMGPGQEHYAIEIETASGQVTVIDSMMFVV